MTACRQQGAVLVLVTWVLAVIAVAAFGLSRNTRSAVQLTSVDVRITQARAAAEGAIWRGIFELVKPLNQEPWQTDGTFHEFTVAGADVRVAIQDQTGLVDLNTASPALLQAMMSTVADLDVAEIDGIVDAVLDWRDRDNLKRPSGAEDADYEDAGYDYGAKDAPFNTKEELQQVAGVSRAVYEALASYITVHGQNQRLSLQSAPPHTLAMLPGLTPSDAQTIADARAEGSDGGLGMEVARADGDLTTLRPGTTFEVQAQATVKGISQRLSAAVLIGRNNPAGYEILAWREGYDVAPEIIESDSSGT